ncbi:MAG: formylglycine-generating enzyme family protein [Planctomycetaceae bacterium]
MLYYVEPHYSWLDRNEQMPEVVSRFDRSPKKSAASTPVAPHDGGELELAALLRKSPRLCLTEGSGTGKTVFSRRVQAFFASETGRESLRNGEYCLPIRFDTRDGVGWPTDYRAASVKAVASCLGVEPDSDTQRLSDFVEWAIRNSRLVLILDALDQVSQPRVACQSLHTFLSEPEVNCDVVLTTRPFALAADIPLFESTVWAFAQIEPFDVEQQYRYLTAGSPVLGLRPIDELGLPPSNDGPDRIEQAWKLLFPDMPLTAEIRRIPGVAAQLEELARVVRAEARRDEILEDLLRAVIPSYEEAKELLQVPLLLTMIRQLATGGDLQQFSTRSELYLQASLHTIRESLPKLMAEFDDDLIDTLELVISAAAFQMMTDDRYDYVVKGRDRVRSFRMAVERRVAVTVDWKLVHRATSLSYRNVVESSTSDSISFKHKSMMEFYCGLYLASGIGTPWRDDAEREKVEEAASDENWTDAWRFAIEMPPEIIDSGERLRLALAGLFRRPKSARPRPTELIYRAWHLFADDSRISQQLRHRGIRWNRLPGAAAVIADFRQEFCDLCDGQYVESQSAAVKRALSEIANSLTVDFVQCPPDDWEHPTDPQRDPTVARIGSNWSIWERPPHLVRVQPFEMKATTVTREQYRLFDPHIETAYRTDFDQHAPAEDCPAITISWYDAFVFSKWLGDGYRLPTETEWEFACRAGRDGEDDHFFWGATLFSQRARFQPNPDDPFQDSADTDPEWKKVTVSVGMQSDTTFAPNAFGLWHMHGNVWEWCWDWFKDDSYQKRVHSHPTVVQASESQWQELIAQTVFHADKGPLVGSLRVLRGGSWFYPAIRCRSAVRNLYGPGFRSNDAGIRLCRDCVSSQSSSSHSELLLSEL